MVGVDLLIYNEQHYEAAPYAQVKVCAVEAQIESNKYSGRNCHSVSKDIF